jgi:PAS domain S-box-containing protein
MRPEGWCGRSMLMQRRRCNRIAWVHKNLETSVTMCIILSSQGRRSTYQDMAHARLGFLVGDDLHSATKFPTHYSRIEPDYVTVVNANRKYVEVSPSFCKLLGYPENELIGRLYDEFTAPRTSNIEAILDIFRKVGHMEGIWVLLHKSGTKIFVRYDAFVREDGLYESHMELIGAGA